MLGRPSARVRRLLASLPAVLIVGGGSVLATTTYCDSISANSGCGDGFNCVHSASVDCPPGSIATVTYDTTCDMPPPQGGTASTTTVAARLKTENTPVTNRCNCKLLPSLGRTWGQICDEGDCCACFETSCP